MNLRRARFHLFLSLALSTAFLHEAPGGRLSLELDFHACVFRQTLAFLQVAGHGGVERARLISQSG